MTECADIVRIDGLGRRGDGTGLLEDGRRVFVPGALPGELVRAVAESGGGTAEEGLRARLEAVVERSAERAEPPCPHYGVCGGCSLQHMGEGLYRAFKSGRVEGALAQAGVRPAAIDPPSFSPPRSRRRAVFSARCAADGTVQIGFNERASHRLAVLQSCAVLRPELTERLPVLRALLPPLMLAGESYDVALTCGAAGAVDLLVTVLGARKRVCDAALRAGLCALGEAGAFARVSWQEMRGWAPQTVYEKEPFRVSFGGVAVVPPPGGFLQATEEGEAALVTFALGALGRKKRVADLYAGAGTFSLALSAAGHKVDAYEGDGDAVAALTAAGAGRTGLRAVRRDLAREALSFQELSAYDAVLTDPPRNGAAEQMREIARSRLKAVISISCAPDTFARDAAILVQGGFTMKRLRVVDQFVWSAHVEAAGLFVRG